MDQRSASQSHEATHSVKPPLPLVAKRSSGAIQQTQNIKRLLKNKGASENDPLAEEQNNYNTSQTELMPGGQNSDFFEEDANQYKMTRLQEKGPRQQQYKSLNSNQSRGQLSSMTNARTLEENTLPKNIGQEADEGLNSLNRRINQSTLNNNNDPVDDRTPKNGTMVGARITLNSSAYARSGASNVNFPASAVNQHSMQIVNPMTPSDGMQTQCKPRIVSSFIRDGDDSGAGQVVEAATSHLNQNQSSNSCLAAQENVAVLPTGVAHLQQEPVSRDAQSNSHIDGQTQNLRNQSLGITLSTGPNATMTQSYGHTQAIQAQGSFAEGTRQQPSQHSRTSEGHSSSVPPAVVTQSNQLQNEGMPNNREQNLTLEQMDTYHAELTAQIVTGEAQAISSTDNNVTQQPRESITSAQVDDYDSTNRRILTDSNPETVAEQVQSAEFAMSTFNILNNKGEMQDGHLNDENMMKALLTEDNFVEAGRCATEQIGTTNQITNVQRAHILSGTRELKQSNSVLTGHGAENNPNVHQKDEPQQAKTMMQMHDQAKQIDDSRPNRPLEQHFDAVDRVAQPQTGKPPITEQVVYSRLPKNYFMEEAHEQMDIDIAINDIKQLRQGFITYVNDQGGAQQQDADDLEHIDDFLDPSKFIERHFGSENPDIIFQEVIDSVPDPPLPPPTDKQQLDSEIIVEAAADILDKSQDGRLSDNGLIGSGGGFTEQNVTPNVPDMWADNLTEENAKDYSDRELPPQRNQAESNLITGETFLKDARQIDQSIEEMNNVEKTVGQLKQPYNDNEMASKPENEPLAKSNPQTITLAIESQEAIKSDQINLTQQQMMMGLETFDNNAEQVQQRVNFDPKLHRCAQSEDNITGEFDEASGDDLLSQQRVLAMNPHERSNVDCQKSGQAAVSSMLGPRGDTLDFGGRPQTFSAAMNQEDHQKTLHSKKSIQVNDQAHEVNITRKRKKYLSNKFEVSSAYPRQQVKVIRMADYFKPSHATMSALNLSGATTADVENSMKEQSQMGAMSELDTIAQETKLKEELDAKLEQDILDNVDVNFIFNKGTSLTSGLIDPDRLFSVMNKLKELAYKQLQSGSNQINYAEIVAYLRQSEGFFADEIVHKEDRLKLYAGEVNIHKDNEEDQNQNVSTQQIVSEPVLVGLENEQEEKKRRWEQCMNFLRNNPKLLLQMIPDPDDDIDCNFSSDVISVGRPRPSKRQSVGKPPKSGTQKTNASKGPPRFLAISHDKKGMISSNKLPASQRPIKVRTNALRGRAFMSSRRASDSQANAAIDNSPYCDKDEAEENMKNGEEGQQDMGEQDVSTTQLQEEGEAEVIDEMLNIQTRPAEIQNPSNLEVDVPELPAITPETTKVISSIQPDILEGCITIEDEKLDEDEEPKQTNLKSKRQQSAVTRTTTQKFNEKKRRQGSIENLKTKNSLQTKISVLRGFSSKACPPMEGGTKFMIRPMQRINANSAMVAHESDKHSFTTTPSGITTMYQTAPNKGFFSNSNSNQGKGVSSVFRRQTGHLNERNKIQEQFYGSNIQNKRAFKSNKNVHSMTRVFSEAFSNQPRSKRPITAVHGPSMQQAQGVGRRRLASNSILNISAQNRQNTRQFLYNKQNYQTNGCLENVESKVAAELQARKIAQNSIVVQQEGPRRIRIAREGPINRSSHSPQSQGVLMATMQESAGREQAASAAIPSIFRQSNEEMSALSNIQQDGGPFYFYDGASQPEQKLTAEASSQYCVEDHLAIDDMRRNIEVQTDIQDVTGDLTVPQIDRSLQSHLGIAMQAHVDWAYTPLCIAVLNKSHAWNQNMEKRVFVEAEVDVVLSMIKSNFTEFNKLDKLAPYHGKALETLKELLLEQGLDSLVIRFQKQYLEITAENTIKMLLRSKLVFSARQLFIQIFEKILRYEVASADAKSMIESKETYKLPLQELNELRLRCGRMYEMGEKVIHEIRQLRADRKGQYSQPFIFKKKDLTLQIKNEVAEVRQLVKVYRVKRQDDSEDSDKPARFVVVTDDEVSEREEVRDSNYVGTDLYWENRFYQVKPFKKPDNDEYAEGDYEPDGGEDGAFNENQKEGRFDANDINDKEFVMI